MPKIPSYTAQLRPTTDINIPKSGVQMPITAPFTGLQSTIADYYVKEKTTEANTNALKVISDLYNDQEDGTQGLFSIKSELSANPNPSQVTKEYDDKINTLWNNTQATRLANVDNFTKSAVKEKFFATAGILKTDVLKGSRDSLFKEETKVADGYYQNETILLKELGAKYLPVYEPNIAKVVNNLNLDAGQKKTLLEERLNFGRLELAQSMLNKNEAENLTEMLKNGTIKLDPKNFNIVFDQAQKQITSNIYSTLTVGINNTPGMNMTQLGEEYKKVENYAKGIFETDKQKELYNKLSDVEKSNLIKHANEKYRIAETSIKIQNDDISRITSDAIQKKMSNVVNSSKIGEYNPSSIESSFGKDEKLKSDLLKINNLVANKQVVQTTPYTDKIEILKKIATGEIININTPFKINNEATGKTLAERVINQRLSKSDFESFNLMMNVKGVDEKTKNNMNLFFNFVKDNEVAVGGIPTFRNFDRSYDVRMNAFVEEMYNRYNNGLKEGKNPEDLLNRTNSNFIGKDASRFSLKRDDLDRQIESIANQTQTKTQYKVGDVITNSKGEKATVLRIEQNGKVILQKQ